MREARRGNPAGLLRRCVSRDDRLLIKGRWYYPSGEVGSQALSGLIRVQPRLMNLEGWATADSQLKPLNDVRATSLDPARGVGRNFTLLPLAPFLLPLLS